MKMFLAGQNGLHNIVKGSAYIYIYIYIWQAESAET